MGALNDPIMKTPCSGVILSGGRNTRFHGKDKAFVRVGGRPMIEHVLTVFRSLFDDIVLVTNDPAKYVSWDLHVVTDIFAGRSSLTGIHAGLFHAVHPHAFFAASRSGSVIVLLKTCFPAFSFVITVLKV